jgi:FAD/FMN-containing dehydrogenase
MTLKERVGSLIEGDAYDDAETLKKYSRDTSILERTPSLVVFPKHAADVAALTKFVREEREAGRQVTLTARSAGTDMTGGPLTDSIVMVFTKYMNHVGKITPGSATTQPGVYYRDFEKETLAKGGAILPSYPASRELCAMGGIVNNNSGGELTLRYGKTENYIEKLEVVLSDGSQATLKPLTLAEVALKEREPSLEASIYRNTRKLIEENRDEIERARPTVSKNSAGYALWNVFDEKAGTFDLSRLVCGAQGTLAMLTEATLRLVKPVVCTSARRMTGRISHNARPAANRPG